MPRTMEDTMSPRLDASQTQRATSAPSPEHPDHDPAGHGADVAGLEGLPEIPPYD
jgi:RNA polymerase sigma-B factor